LTHYSKAYAGRLCVHRAFEVYGSEKMGLQEDRCLCVRVCVCVCALPSASPAEVHVFTRSTVPLVEVHEAFCVCDVLMLFVN
jgi:hypothetical protein